jgi:Tfp pilus assembly protein PilE
MISKKRFSKGVTLIEVVLAALIAAMTTTAIYSVVLSGFVSESKADKREASALVLKTAQEVLKSYVAVEMSNTLYRLPGTTAGRWSADSSGRWALAAGTHNISSLLSKYPVLTSASLSYRVSNFDCGLGSADNVACKTVRFTLTYAD